MNKLQTRFQSLAVALLLALTFLAFARQASAVCATVKIQIDQDMAFERQGFEARMTIDNALPDTALTNFAVALQFLDQNKNPVSATADASGTGTFFYRLTDPAAIPTSIASGTAQTLKWLIIPSPGAGGTNSVGVPYYVGAQVTYQLNGAPQLLDLDPAPITVKPMPNIAVEYFLPER